MGLCPRKTLTVTRGSADCAWTAGGVPGLEPTQVFGEFGVFFPLLTLLSPQTCLVLHAKGVCTPTCLEPFLSVNTHTFILLKKYGKTLTNTVTPAWCWGIG